ncbi:histone-lysine N-methyltransferase ASHR1-like [Galendromus occidentalis]|uniref:Histone-lysine N-methyltransferase ASHR1-like n=1 Tax=Galendromus occidentalis TaxID=34638 RepID=A0AAJ6QPF9_9ACAR|nr:histone-lysine N-methyltransferase ASHR1-like [Galendromus occidentalis]
MPEFRPRDVIHRESPYCVVVDDGVLDRICSYCLYWKEVEPCECLLVFYCSNFCKLQDARDHEIECLLSRTRGRESLLDDEVRLVVRALAKNFREERIGSVSEGNFYGSRRSISDLETHLEDLSEDDRLEVQEKAQRIASLMRAFTNTEVHEVALMLQRLRINMFQLSDHRAVTKGIACYLGISVVDHTCEDSGNFVLAFKGREIILRALKNFTVQDMGDFRINYIDATIPTEERRRALLAGYFFACQCAKCLAESTRAVNSSPPSVEHGGLLHELDALFLSGCSDREMFRAAKNLMERIELSNYPTDYHRDLCFQIQSAALALGRYEESIRYGLMAVGGTENLYRLECAMVSLCEAMQALGWNHFSHPLHKQSRRVSRYTVKLLRSIYGDDYIVINEMKKMDWLGEGNMPSLDGVQGGVEGNGEEEEETSGETR